MRCERIYLDEVVNTQGVVFKLAYENNYNIIDFIEKYLNSKIRSYIDAGLVEYCTMTADRIFSLLDKSRIKQERREVNIKEAEKVDWIGKFYAICQWNSNISSEKLVSKMKPIDVYTHYNTLKLMDMEIASKIYLKNIGLL